MRKGRPKGRTKCFIVSKRGWKHMDGVGKSILTKWKRQATQANKNRKEKNDSSNSRIERYCLQVNLKFITLYYETDWHTYKAETWVIS